MGDTMWIDLRKWTGLRGHFRDFLEVVAVAPVPLPADRGEWQEWTAAQLTELALRDGWQPGRYHYTAERRDDEGQTVEVCARGLWDWHG